MSQTYRSGRGTKKRRRPLDSAQMEELALAYVARFATTASKLETYLKRKLRERGYVGEDEGADPPDHNALVERFVDKGYVDDAGYARARSSGLLRRGYGPRRIAQVLRQAGVGEKISSDVEPDTAMRREAVVTMARKRRFGPFDAQREDGSTEEQHRRREKHLAAMIRAGHDFAGSQMVLDAPDEDCLLDWVAEAREEEEPSWND